MLQNSGVLPVNSSKVRVLNEERHAMFLLLKTINRIANTLLHVIVIFQTNTRKTTQRPVRLCHKLVWQLV